VPEDEPDYRYTTMDIYLDPTLDDHGVGKDAIQTLPRHRINDHGHHRLEMDPAADNEIDIHCYMNFCFRPAGIPRRRERQRPLGTMACSWICSPMNPSRSRNG
jgi:aminoglycoside 6'-N-acetyltransferase